MSARIALVEDNPDNRLLVQALLEDHFQVEEYETGILALEGMRRSPPDLVLLDISLPELDGPEVLRIMKEEEALRDIPVVALTAHAMAGDRERFLSQGFDEYLTKPIMDEEFLIRTIRELLDSGRG